MHSIAASILAATRFATFTSALALPQRVAGSTPLVDIEVCFDDRFVDCDLIQTVESGERTDLSGFDPINSVQVRDIGEEGLAGGAEGICIFSAGSSQLCLNNGQTCDQACLAENGMTGIITGVFCTVASGGCGNPDNQPIGGSVEPAADGFGA